MDNLSIGPEVRQLRRARGLSLEDLKRLSGTSVSFLSAIERGTRRPSIKTLSDIAAALEIDIQWFFQSPRGGGPLEQQFVVRRENRRDLTGVYKQSPQDLGYHDALLSSSIGGRFYMGLARYAPHSSFAIRRFHRHEGEEHGFVVKGQLELKLGEETITLREGDSYSFDGSTPHSARNTTDEEVILVWAVSPVVIPKAVEFPDADEGQAG